MHGCIGGSAAVGPRLAGAAGGFRVSLVIPAWNEQETIRRAIHDANAALTTVATEFEIIVVDDGSTDATADAVRAEAAANPRVRLIQQPRHFGYGAALRAGFQASALDLVAFTDADCQFDLRELEYVLPLAARYDIVCGYRIDRQEPGRRHFYSWGYNALVRLLLGSPVRDIDCAMKVFRRERLLEILPESENFVANAEMLSRAQRLGLSIVEVGVHHRPRAGGRSKVSLRDVPTTLSSLLPFWWSHVLFPAAASGTTRFTGHFWAGLVLLALLAGVLLFPNLSYPLIEPGEGRYAEIAREMVARGDWIVPTLNHEPYYDKPPLVYWLVAASLRIFGTSTWAARVVPAAAALLTVLATFFFGTRIVGMRSAFLGSLVLTLSIGFVCSGRYLMLDGVLSLAVVVSMFAAYEATCCRRFRWAWWIASAVACAMGLLTKGPVALVLAAPPVVVHGWLDRRVSGPNIRQWSAYLGIVLALAAPWYVAMITRDPTFARHFFWSHNVSRFLLGSYHERPFWFYLPVLLVGGLPGSLLLIPLVRFLFSRAPATCTLRAAPLGYFLLWAGWCVLFFSLSRGKLPPYILPALPPMAVMLGYFLDQALFRQSLANCFRNARYAVPRHAAAVLCGAAIFLTAGACAVRLRSVTESLITASVWATCLILALTWARRLPAAAMWALCGAVAVGVIGKSSHDLLPAWAARHSPLAASDSISDLLRDEQTAVACWGREFGSIPFFCSRDNVRNFSRRAPAEMTDFLAAHPRTLLVIKRTAELDWFRSALPAGMTLSKLGDSRDATFALIENRSPAATAGRRTTSPRTSWAAE